MTFTIEITPELEQQLKQAAEAAGLTPHAYAVLLLQQTLQPKTPASASDSHLPKPEADLLQQINYSLSTLEWQHYHTLIQKRNAETLTAEEQTELITLSDQIEAANVQRIQAVAALAKLRNISIKDLMNQLGLQPIHHA